MLGGGGGGAKALVADVTVIFFKVICPSTNCLCILFVDTQCSSEDLNHTYVMKMIITSKWLWHSGHKKGKYSTYSIVRHSSFPVKYVGVTKCRTTEHWKKQAQRRAAGDRYGRKYSKKCITKSVNFGPWAPFALLKKGPQTHQKRKFKK